MSVKPLKITVERADDITEIIEAWVYSRPSMLKFSLKSEGAFSYYVVTDKTKNKEYDIYDYFELLLKQDSSFMYFANVDMTIKGSLFLREFLYSFKYNGKWAKTNRHSLPREVNFSSEAYNERDEKLKEIYLKKLSDFDNGKIKDADEVKSYLPLSFQTTFQLKLSFKEFMRIVGYAFNQFGKCKFTEELWSAVAEQEDFKPYLSLIGKYSNYKDPSFPSSLKNCKVKKKYSRNFGMIQYKNKVGYTLYSHLIRHEGLKIDGYIDFMKDYLSNKSIRDSRASFEIRVLTEEERWIEIIRVRTAWFALVRNFNDPNNWGWILKDFLTGNLEKDKNYLKYFKNGKFDSSLITTYSVDEDLKVRKGNKYQLPDAFALECKSLVERRIKEQGSNPLLEDYLQIFEQGYVMDNPNNELRRKYEQFNNNNGSSKRK